ncbi:TonB-dependent receptor [Paraglaciecola sp.]|uniref:TonB-dependent receptor n=1 Tax=Paraglaciecola sp. TaxID=1920173 RepID=UPI003EF8F971
MRILFLVTLLLLSSSLRADASFEELMEMNLQELLEVEITSRRSSEKLGNTPYSVSIISHKDIHKYNLNSLYDLAYLVPNFSFRRSFGRWLEQPAMRGITTISATSTVPTSGLIIDGMGTSGVSMLMPLFDLEQVEILRGAEAAMFGRSTFSGAVNYVSKRPEQSNYTQVNFTKGKYQQDVINLVSNYIVNDDVAIRVSASHDARANYVNNALGSNGGGYGAEQTQYAKFAINWQYNSRLELLGYVSFLDTEDGHLPVYLQTAKQNNCFLDTRSQYYCGEVNVPDALGYSFYPELWDYYLRQKAKRAHIEANYVDNTYDVTFRSAYTQTDLGSSFDGDFYELDSAFTSQINVKTSRTSELYSNFYFDNLRILFGLTYFDSQVASEADNYLIRASQILPLSESTTIQSVKNYAAFGSFEWKFRDTYKFIFDLRITEDEVTNNLALDYSQQSWTNFQPKLTLSKQFPNNWLGYFSVAWADKPGGFNSRLTDVKALNETEQQKVNERIFYDQEGLRSYEIGLKGEIISNYLYINIAAFDYRWKDLVLSQPISYIDEGSQPIRASSLANGGEATSRGFEAEVDASFSKEIKAKLSVAYASTELINTWTQAQEILTGNGDVSGNEIPGAPKKMASLSVDYRKDLSANLMMQGTLMIGYEGKRWAAVHNLAEIPSTTRLNIRFSFSSGNSTLYLWGKNLLDNDSPESVARFGDAATFFVKRGFAMTLPEPKMYGLGFKHHF